MLERIKGEVGSRKLCGRRNGQGPVTEGTLGLHFQDWPLSCR